MLEFPRTARLSWKGASTGSRSTTDSRRRATRSPLAGSHCAGDLVATRPSAGDRTAVRNMKPDRRLREHESRSCLGEAAFRREGLEGGCAEDPCATKSSPAARAFSCSRNRRSGSYCVPRRGSARGGRVATRSPAHGCRPVAARLLDGANPSSTSSVLALSTRAFAVRETPASASSCETRPAARRPVPSSTQSARSNG